MAEVLTGAGELLVESLSSSEFLSIFIPSYFLSRESNENRVPSLWQPTSYQILFLILFFRLASGCKLKKKKAAKKGVGKARGREDSWTPSMNDDPNQGKVNHLLDASPTIFSLLLNLPSRLADCDSLICTPAKELSSAEALSPPI